LWRHSYSVRFGSAIRNYANFIILWRLSQSVGAAAGQPLHIGYIGYNAAREFSVRIQVRESFRASPSARDAAAFQSERPAD